MILIPVSKLIYNVLVILPLPIMNQQYTGVVLQDLVLQYWLSHRHSGPSIINHEVKFFIQCSWITDICFKLFFCSILLPFFVRKIIGNYVKSNFILNMMYFHLKIIIIIIQKPEDWDCWWLFSFSLPISYHVPHWSIYWQNYWTLLWIPLNHTPTLSYLDEEDYKSSWLHLHQSRWICLLQTYHLCLPHFNHSDKFKRFLYLHLSLKLQWLNILCLDFHCFLIYRKDRIYLKKHESGRKEYDIPLGVII